MPRPVWEVIRLSRQVAKEGWLEPVFATFGISLIVWLALYAVLQLLRDSEPVKLTTGDLAILGVTGLSFVVPVTAFIFVRRYEPTGAQIFFLYKNEITASPPYLRAQLDNYLQRLRVAVGQKPVPSLMFHLAASTACKPSHFTPMIFNAS